MKKLPLEVRRRRAAVAKHKAHVKKCANAISVYKGIRLICAWTERDGKTAFVIPYLDNKIVWIPTEYTIKPNKYTCILKRRIDIDQYFEEAGYPVEHIQLKLRLDREKRRKS